MDTEALLDVKYKTKHISNAYNDAMVYMEGRKSGTIKSIATPWTNMNTALMGGIEWNTINIIGARPATGKTLMANLITRESFALNPSEDFIVLDMQFEMLSRVSAMRELSKHMRKPMKYLASVPSVGVMTEADMETAFRYFDAHKHLPIFILEEPVTVHNFNSICEGFCKAANEQGKKVLITLDHSVLLRKTGGGEKSTQILIEDLGSSLTYLKKAFDCSFIILSQLNREIEKPDRIKIPLLQYPNTSDIFGGDALFTHADNMIILNRPAKFNLNLYGPLQYAITSEDVIAAHLLKARNGNEGILWFKADFANMNFIEMPASEIPVATKSTKL